MAHLIYLTTGKQEGPSAFYNQGWELLKSVCARCPGACQGTPAVLQAHKSGCFSPPGSCAGVFSPRSSSRGQGCLPCRLARADMTFPSNKPVPSFNF